MAHTDIFILSAIRIAITEVKKETGITISEDEALEIITYQGKGISYAMANKLPAKVDHIGKFLIKEEREEGIAAKQAGAKLGLKGKELQDFLKQSKINNDLKRNRTKAPSGFSINRILTNEDTGTYTNELPVDSQD